MSGGKRKSSLDAVTLQAPGRNGCSQDAPPTQKWGRVTGVIVVVVQPPRGDRSVDVLTWYCIKELVTCLGMGNSHLAATLMCLLDLKTSNRSQTKEQSEKAT